MWIVIWAGAAFEDKRTPSSHPTRRIICVPTHGSGCYGLIATPKMPICARIGIRLVHGQGHSSCTARRDEIKASIRYSFHQTNVEAMNEELTYRWHIL